VNSAPPRAPQGAAAGTRPGPPAKKRLDQTPPRSRYPSATAGCIRRRCTDGDPGAPPPPPVARPSATSAPAQPPPARLATSAELSGRTPHGRPATAGSPLDLTAPPWAATRPKRGFGAPKNGRPLFSQAGPPKSTPPATTRHNHAIHHAPLPHPSRTPPATNHPPPRGRPVAPPPQLWRRPNRLPPENRRFSATPPAHGRARFLQRIRPSSCAGPRGRFPSGAPRKIRGSRGASSSPPTSLGMVPAPLARFLKSSPPALTRPPCGAATRSVPLPPP